MLEASRDARLGLKTRDTTTSPRGVTRGVRLAHVRVERSATNQPKEQKRGGFPLRLKSCLRGPVRRVVEAMAITLKYFDVKARAEPIRVALKYAKARVTEGDRERRKTRRCPSRTSASASRSGRRSRRRSHRRHCPWSKSKGKGSSASRSRLRVGRASCPTCTLLIRSRRSASTRSATSRRSSSPRRRSRQTPKRRSAFARSTPERR
mmetsp:Transcript_17007/g.53093  ORF Transcript_17007/g.53093 Transcript_17007/m.53093 type:complete len:207 (-) Transcript_17007:379-999(-)